MGTKNPPSRLHVGAAADISSGCALHIKAAHFFE